MAKDYFTPNNNQSVIRLLSRKLSKENKVRNGILFGAIVLNIITFCMVFGITFGKQHAEYMKIIRKTGTTASGIVYDANETQYKTMQTLSYINNAGKMISIGSAKETTSENEEIVCMIEWLDVSAWENLVAPAYSKIVGSYPKEKQEIMLSKQALEILEIDQPQIGDKISLEVATGLFETKKEQFILCGWFTDYIDKTQYLSKGFVSEKKLEEWDFDTSKNIKLLFAQIDSMEWRKAEERLYHDLSVKNANQKISVSNTASYLVFNQNFGGYEIAIVCAVLIFMGMLFLIRNVMQISMMKDIRQIGLLNLLGTTEKQIRRIYYAQIKRILFRGILVGTGISCLILIWILPRILGKQYLGEYGGVQEFQLFRLDVMIASMVFSAFTVWITTVGIIRKVTRNSVLDNFRYTGIENVKKKVKNQQFLSRKYKKFSSKREIIFMAWKNHYRYRIRFLLTVFSLFLGIETFLIAVVIVSGSDYIHAIEQQPDFLIAGEFSEQGKAEGYGREYLSRDVSEDPMYTEGDNLSLLYENMYKEFSPVSMEVKEQILKLDGIEDSYVMEGAYIYSTLTCEAIYPFASKYDMESKEVKEGTGYSYDYEWVEGSLPDTIQILNDEQIEVLCEYIKEKALPVDINDWIEGNGVLIVHDHRLSPIQQKYADEAVGEAVYFTSLWDKSAFQSFREGNIENLESIPREKSPIFQLSGYLDNQAEDFPDISQSWHGAEGMIYYFISEKGFEKIPATKKTLSIQLEVEEGKEEKIQNEIQNIVLLQNKNRYENGEAGIFSISKLDTIEKAENFITGNKLIFGSLSIVLFIMGIINYVNIFMTSIFSRKKELYMMEKIGMTIRQQRYLFLWEGLYYAIIVMVLVGTIGIAILKCVGVYMGQKLSYFVFLYPFSSIFIIALLLFGICLIVARVIPFILYRGVRKSS